MKYQRAKVDSWVKLRHYSFKVEHYLFKDTPDHDIPQTVIEALTAIPNMPVMIGGYLYRVID